MVQSDTYNCCHYKSKKQNLRKKNVINLELQRIQFSLNSYEFVNVMEHIVKILHSIYILGK